MDFCWWWWVVLVGGGGRLCYVWWSFVEGFEISFSSFVEVFGFEICWRIR